MEANVLNQQGACVRLQLNDLDRPKPLPNGDPLKVFTIIEGGPVIERVHADPTNTDFVSWVRQLGKTTAICVSQPPCSSQRETMARSCGRIHMAVARLQKMMSVDCRDRHRDDILLVKIGGKDERESRAPVSLALMRDA